MSKYKLELENAASAYGAAMGRRDWLPGDDNAAVRLHLTKMRIDTGGYDTGGAYWGIGDPLYCAEGEYTGETVRLFVRAHDRESAKRQVRQRLANATFYDCPADTRWDKDRADHA